MAGAVSLRERKHLWQLCRSFIFTIILVIICSSFILGYKSYAFDRLGSDRYLSFIMIYTGDDPPAAVAGKIALVTTDKKITLDFPKAQRYEKPIFRTGDGNVCKCRNISNILLFHYHTP